MAGVLFSAFSHDCNTPQAVIPATPSPLASLFASYIHSFDIHAL
jgi:hypothetical protein